MNWNGTVQTGSAIATYVALVGFYLAGYSPLAFALCTAVLLCLWLSLYSIAATSTTVNRSVHPMDSVVPSLSESICELHSLQSEINALQATFSNQTTARLNSADNSAEQRRNDHE